MRRPAARALCVVAVLLSLVSGAAPAGAAQTAQTIAGTQVAPDDVSLRIDVREDGSAEWTVEYRVRLDDENATEAFESVRADIEANESAYAAQFRDRMNATATTAENATGREMTVRNVSVRASRSQLPQEYGVITYTFVWTDFAVVDGDTIRAGDALEGLFLDEETTLLFSWPEGYGFEAAEPAPDDRRTRTVVWDGPLDFGPGEPNLRVSPSAADPTATTAGGASGADGVGSETADSGPSAGGVGPIPILAGGLLLAAVAAAGVHLYRRKEARPDGEPDGSGTSGAAAAVGSETPAQTDDGTATETTGETPGAAATTGAADGDDRRDAGGPETAGADGPESDDADARPWEDELLSNRERVLALIEHEGGRLKQQEVARTLDWTDAKTSQVVRKMRDEDELDAFRLGRENVLVLPGESLEPDGEE